MGTCPGRRAEPRRTVQESTLYLTHTSIHCRFVSAQRPGVLHGAQIFFDYTLESDSAR